MKQIGDSAEWGQAPLADPMDQDAVTSLDGKEPKVAFLIFANDRMNNEDVWQHWMEQAHAEELPFRLYIHASGLPPQGDAEWKSQRFKQYLVGAQAQTSWCKMWEAQMLMFEKALKDDSHLTHFMILSSDTVPIKPLSYIYKDIKKQPLSRFCVDDYWRSPWPRAETWSLMRKGDVKFFLKHKLYASNHFRRDCEEELAWYFPLRARWSNHGEQAAIARDCVVFTNWKDGEKACKEAWAANTDKCNCKKLRKSNQTEANFKHPVTYHKLGKAEFEELVRSPFWFARKFSEGAVSEKLKSILDIDISKPQKKLFGFLR